MLEAKKPLKSSTYVPKKLWHRRDDARASCLAGNNVALMTFVFFLGLYVCLFMIFKPNLNLNRDEFDFLVAAVMLFIISLPLIYLGISAFKDEFFIAEKTLGKLRFQKRFMRFPYLTHELNEDELDTLEVVAVDKLEEGATPQSKGVSRWMAPFVPLPLNLLFYFNQERAGSHVIQVWGIQFVNKEGKRNLSHICRDKGQCQKAVVNLLEILQAD